MQFVVLAAGHGTRLGLAHSKGLVTVGGQALVTTAIAHAAELGGLQQIVVVTNPDATDEMARVIAASNARVPIELVTASTRSAFESLLAATRYAPAWKPTLVGTVDSLVRPKAIGHLARSPGDGSLLVRPDDDPDGLQVMADATGRVLSVGPPVRKVEGERLVSAGWFVFFGELSEVAERAAADGVQTLRAFQAWLVGRYDIRQSTVEQGFDIDTPDNLRAARLGVEREGWSR
jgi:choline kinase